MKLRTVTLLALLAPASCAGDDGSESPDASTIPPFDGGGDAGAAVDLAWREVTTAPSPGARVDPAMAYDPQRNVVVLYGGEQCQGNSCSGTNSLDDLWEWDGSKWTPIDAPGVTPGPRSRHAMAYDPTREQIVISGGGGGTFGWNGSSWEEIVTFCNFGCPLDRVGHALAYHAGWDRLVLFSGVGGAANDVAELLRSDSYQLDGDFWRALPDSGEHPEGRVGSNLVYDPVRDVMWLFGGSRGYGSTEYPNDLWKLDDSGWHRQIADAPPGPTAPWGRRTGAFVWHDGLGKAVLFGGWSYPAIQSVGALEAPDALSVWLWDGTSWEQKPEWFTDAAARSRQAAASFAASDTIIQFGGLNFVDFPTDTTFVLEPQ